MNSALIVKLNADSNYVPVKYRIVEMTVGSTAGATYCVLEVVGVGFDTEGNYDLWKSGRYYDTASGVTHATGRDPVGIQGTLGALSVATLDALSIYSPRTPSLDRY